MSTTIDKIPISWDSLERMIEHLAHQIKSDPHIKSVWGLPRGGLIPAVLLSHHTGLPMKLGAASTTLIVDDIADSGITLDKWRSFKSLTLHHKEKSIVTPTYFHSTVPEEFWIVYPWERDDAETIADYLKTK